MSVTAQLYDQLRTAAEGVDIQAQSAQRIQNVLMQRQQFSELCRSAQPTTAQRQPRRKAPADASDDDHTKTVTAHRSFR